ncbi:MAG: hypothetical protein K8R54_17460 [Bacteroidales bacterium]|nr:hypothetical protein [Bacteroidales bacterium]
MSKANSFKHKTNHVKTIFDDVVNYLVFSYHQLLESKEQISKSYCEEHTSFKFEDYIKWYFVKKYLQKQENKTKSGISKIQNLTFQFETEKEYWKNGKMQRDKIDIFVSNLGLPSAWNHIAKEDHYFAFECKRIKQKETIDNAYLSDIEKFINRDYWKTGFRFPFNGMIGFVENKLPDIPKIIEDLEIKLSSETYNTFILGNKKNLKEHKISNFKYCRVSEHKHISKKITIKVYHLIFDYSEILGA